MRQTGSLGALEAENARGLGPREPGCLRNEKPMSNDTPSGQEASESVDEQRAQWERFSMTVLGGEGGGYVNVRNDSHGDDAGAHIYSVAIGNGEATDCSCPHAVHRGAHCKHQVAVENRPLILTASAAAAASTPRVATDGGENTPDAAETPDTGADRGDGTADAGGDVSRPDDDERGTDAAAGLGTVTGWGGSVDPDTENEEVDESPL
jgi:hypothetical protein